MGRFTVSRSTLGLELLESRTLLAGDVDVSFAQVSAAIAGTGAFTVAFNPKFVNTEVILTGSASSTLTVDFDLLPSFVTSVAISGFDSVKFTGTDNLDKLVVSNVDSLVAGGISLARGVYADDVGVLVLAAGGDMAVLSGQRTKIDIADLAGTTIISDLKVLELESKTNDVFVVSLNSDQLVQLHYQPQKISVVGLADASKQVSLYQEPVNESPSNPESPGAGTVVVEVPTNEKTDALLARLRELLGKGRADNHQLVFDAVNSSGLLGSQRTMHSTSPTTLLLPDALRGANVRPPATFAPELARLGDEPRANLPTLGEIELAKVRTESFDRLPEQKFVFAWSENPPEDALPESDATFLTGVPAGRDLPVIRTNEGAVPEALLTASVHDSRILKYHILDQISAELVPGEQTAFLLVDPKPSRSILDRNRESGLSFHA